MDKQMIDDLVNQVIRELEKKDKCLEVEASGRHVHLSKEDAQQLFGRDTLTPERELSQPGQFLSKEKVNLIGPKGSFKDVAVLGPLREKTQVEVSMTDARVLGISPVLKESGDLTNCADLWIQYKDKMIEAKSSAMVAKRHIHMTPEDANHLQVKDGETVAVRVYGQRPITFEDVLVRVNSRYQLRMHIDYDEANAVGLGKNTYGKIISTGEMEKA